MRWLQLFGPVALVGFLVAACLARPGPGLSGRHLLVSIATGGFLVGVLGRNATSVRRGAAHAGYVGLLVAGAVLLMTVQPGGPGAECVLLGALCVVVLLPGRLAAPVLVLAFAAIGLVAGLTDHGVANAAVLGGFALFYGMLYLSFRLVQANRQAERLVAELHRSRLELAEAAQSAERHRLAREMHDVLAHSLSGLTLQLEGSRMRAARLADPELTAAIERAHQLARTGLEDARRAIGLLRDDDLPGPEGIPALVAQFERDRGVPCALAVTGRPGELAPETRLAVYRVAQESLTNVARHAVAPARVELIVAYSADEVRLSVADLGVDPGVGTGPVGYGLTGMRERAELLGGTLTAGRTSTGFRVELVLPAGGPDRPAVPG